MKTILMIDDDQDLTEVVKFLINREENLKLLIAHDIAQGVNIVRQERPDLLLMDIMLPGLNGAEALRLMKNIPGIENVPVIFCTSLLSQSDGSSQSLCINVGGETYAGIAKPFHHKEFISKIRNTLGDS